MSRISFLSIVGRSRRTTLGLILALVLLVLPQIALADNVITDGDYATPVAHNDLVFGDICSGQSKSGNALLAINRVGGGNTYADSAIVAISVDQVTSNVSASMTDNQISLPSDWVSKPNNTLSGDTGSAQVTVNTTGLPLGSHTGNVKFNASGAKAGGGTLDRPGNLGVTWNVITCQSNQPPTAEAGGPYSGNEGSAIQLDGTASSDPDGDALTYSWGWLSADALTCTFNDASAVDPTITCDDNGSVELMLTVSDGNASVNDTASLTVNNVAPTVTIVSPADGSVYAVNTPINFVIGFTDPGSADTWTCELASAAGNIDPPCTTPQHTFGGVTFAAAGIYNVTATVTDDDGGEGSTSIMVVVYDPSAGFVTGGGWINSPAGAYKLDDSLAGKATFGFVSKYQKGANVPTGNTEFQFHAAGLNFKSAAYEWLVVSGGQAQFRGTGTINGAGNYGFMLTAGDGSPDTFRLKIWDRDTNETVYDNGSNQALGSGSIIIHTGKK